MKERENKNLYVLELGCKMASLTDRIIENYSEGLNFGSAETDAFDLAALEIKIAEAEIGIAYRAEVRMKQWQTALVFALDGSYDYLHELITNKGNFYLNVHRKGSDDWDKLGRAFLNLSMSV